MMEFPQIVRRRLSAEVSDHLEQRILNGGIPEGSRLPSEKDLATSFGVSRTAIREALKGLEERGLVRIENGRGAYVTPLSHEVLRGTIARYVQSRLTPDTIHEFYQFREVLEGAAAQIAAARATDCDIEQLALALAQMEAHEDDADGWMEADIAFHRALIGATHNPFLMHLLEPVIDCLQDAIKVSFDGEGARTGVRCHAAILDGIRRGDADAAHRAMLITLGDSAERVRRSLEE